MGNKSPPNPKILQIFPPKKIFKELLKYINGYVEQSNGQENVSNVVFLENQ